MEYSSHARNYYLFLITIMFVIAGTIQLQAGEESQSSWEVMIDVFSGRPNPIFTLEQSEIVQLDKALSQAKVLSKTTRQATDKSADNMLPSKLGYRGLYILKLDASKSLISEIQICGKDILVRDQTNKYIKQAEDNSLELYLLELALTKGANSKELQSRILEDIGKR